MVSSSYPRFWIYLCCSMQEPAELSNGSLLKAHGSLAPGAESMFAGKQFYLEACLLIVPYLNVRVYDLGGGARLGARWVCKVEILVFTCGWARHMSRVSQHSRGCCHAPCHAAWRHHRPAPRHIFSNYQNHHLLQEIRTHFSPKTNFHKLCKSGADVNQSCSIFSQLSTMNVRSKYCQILG